VHFHRSECREWGVVLRVSWPDTWWSMLRWRISTWMLWRALRIAPQGSAACDLEDRLLDWADKCRMQWHKRYPHPEISCGDDSL
jgi:hypothetical protein